MKSILFAAAAALCAPVLAYAQPDAGEALLDKLIAHPGSYAQVCDVMIAPQNIPYRAFEIMDFAGAGFSKANQAEMEKNRALLVKAIRARLLAIDLSRDALQPSKDPAPEESMDGDDLGCDPATLNPLLLGLIQQLKATETLPELLAVEQKLVEGIAKAKEDAKAKPPVVAGWFVSVEGVEYDETESVAKRERRFRLFQARVAQRDLVMIMAKLMRGEKFPPYLETSIEAAYAKGLKAIAKEEGIENYKPGDPLPKEKEYLEITMDGITGLPTLSYSPVIIPYTRESRDQVRAAARKWVAAHP